FGDAVIRQNSRDSICASSLRFRKSSEDRMKLFVASLVVMLSSQMAVVLIQQPDAPKGRIEGIVLHTGTNDPISLTLPFKESRDGNNAPALQDEFLIESAGMNGFGSGIDRGKCHLELPCPLRNQTPLHRVDLTSSVDQPQRWDVVRRAHVEVGLERPQLQRTP